MKKLTTIAALMLLLSVSAFATDGKKLNATNDTKVTKIVSTAFAQDFKQAENVNWDKTQGFYLANFKIKNENMSAAYDEDGAMLGMSRELVFSQLPLATQRVLQQSYSDYNIGNHVTEIFYDGFTNYYLIAENNSKILKLKCSPEGVITVVKSTKKIKHIVNIY
jgi:hypothetical protein